MQEESIHNEELFSILYLNCEKLHQSDGCGDFLKVVFVVGNSKLSCNVLKPCAEEFEHLLRSRVIIVESILFIKYYNANEFQYCFEPCHRRCQHENNHKKIEPSDGKAR